MAERRRSAMYSFEDLFPREAASGWDEASFLSPYGAGAPREGRQPGYDNHGSRGPSYGGRQQEPFRRAFRNSCEPPLGSNSMSENYQQPARGGQGLSLNIDMARGQKSYGQGYSQHQAAWDYDDDIFSGRAQSLFDRSGQGAMARYPDLRDRDAPYRWW
ncbi:hypothetical protein LTR53_005527 [Teratosphaeriaceae sp. CCFEE 6253]|nr:hypothetical protein LTR53_005527 [Teratosphaeriaceae sp. CCFEE 6253]